MECKMRYDKKAITETRVRMRNATMTMKDKLKMRNILPTPCIMMVVSLFSCLEGLFVCA